MIDTSKLNNSIVFSRAIFGVLKAKGTRVEGRGYGPRAEGQGTQTPENNMMKLVVDIWGNDFSKLCQLTPPECNTFFKFFYFAYILENL